jgi:hypothetical protein
MKIKYAILFLMIFSQKSYAQSIVSAKFEQLINKEYLPHKNRESNFLGCGWAHPL